MNDSTRHNQDRAIAWPGSDVQQSEHSHGEG